MLTKSQKIASSLCIVISSSVLLSWLVPSLPTLATQVAMNPMTALGILFCGIAFSSRKHFRLFFASLVFVLACVKLLSFADFDLGVDQMLFANQLAQAGTLPNRIALLTAVAFWFMSLALIFLDSRHRFTFPMSHLLVIPPLVIGLIGFVGHLYSQTFLAQIETSIPIAFNTSLAFILLALGTLFHHGERGILNVFLKQNPSAIVGRRLIPYVLLSPLILGWLRVSAEHRGLVQPEYGSALMTIAWIVVSTSILWICVRNTNRLEGALEANIKREHEGKLLRLKKLFPPNVAEMILSGKIEDPFRWRKTEVTIIFIDIRGFTSFSEKGEPEEVMHLLQSYYIIVAAVAKKHQGTVSHLAGDSIMIFLNAPMPIENPHLKAAEMTLEIRKELEDLWKAYRNERFHLDFGAGIASGYTMIGGIGAEGFCDYTLVGTATNVAARLCGVAEEGQILVSHRFYSSIKGVVEGEAIGAFELKGVSQSVRAFNLTGPKDLTH